MVQPRVGRGCLIRSPTRTSTTYRAPHIDQLIGLSGFALAFPHRTALRRLGLSVRRRSSSGGPAHALGRSLPSTTPQPNVPKDPCQAGRWLHRLE